MKLTTVISFLAAGCITAGEVYTEPMMPAPAPTLWQWFAGGSVGYLTDFETEMYTLHAGVDLPNQLGGWDQAVYLEVGYATLDETFSSSDDNGYESSDPPAGMNGGKRVPVKFDADLIPVTLNYKLERPLSDALNMYMGVGLGMVNVDVSGGGDSDDDWTFYGQIFAGLLYNVNETWEIYGGGRWIYIDDFELFGTDVDHQDDFMLELGTRVNF